MREINPKHKEILRTFIAYSIIGLIMEICVILSWTGMYPSKYLVMVIAAVPHVVLFFAVLIKPVRDLLWQILMMIKNAFLAIYIKAKQVNWTKFGLFIAGNSIICYILCLIKYGFTWRNIAFVFVTVCVISIVVVYHNHLINNIEIVVFCIIMLIGSVYATSLPVSCGISWDDETHFRNAIVMSHSFDGRISVSDREILNKFVSTALEHDVYTKDSHEAWVNRLNTADATGEWEFVGRMKPTIEVWCYLPSALGLFLGRVLGLPYSATFIMGRWFNLLAYALLVCFSMKKLKSGKMILATVSMLPTCIFMAASYARDPWMIGFIMLGFSMLVGIIQDSEKKLELKDLVGIILCFILGVRPKAIYAPIILITVCIPKEKFKSDKQYKYFMIVVMLALLAILATFVLPFLVSSGGGVQDDRGGSEVNAGVQTMYVLSHPFTYAKNLLNFFKSYFSLESGAFYFTAMHYFGNAGNAILLQILLAIVIFTDHVKSEVLLKWPMKFMTLFMSFGTLCLAATAMYIAFTPVYYDTILGCQPRYMLQILFPTVFVLGNVGIENKINQKIYRGVILLTLSYVLLNAVWTLMLSTY